MTRIYRVIVRGRFADLDDDGRARLLDRLAEHDGLPGFQPGGHLAYDRRLDFFSFRVESRVRDDDEREPTEAAYEDATARCLAALADFRVGHRDLSATGTDMSTMWDGP